ncbi:hypothetical protein KC19_10G021500 [Ceratodon purpureus]|uniref:Putative gamma-glutamylcyclotransferase n=1 Tax=Ceratodon purpureus TaxID=3225 RepID=A0A8T0GJK1_CERPU|nr:hypothetical protein KC19_10G021500 [Ceratodon purpureus]
MAATAVRNVFVYGSLLAPEVLIALLHRVPRASLAVVHDFHRYSIKNRIYPAVLPKKGDKVFGKVLFDLSDQELHILDEFEDVEYTKSIVSPLTLKAHDSTHGEPVSSTIGGQAQEMIESGCSERVSNGLTVTNGQTDDVALEDNTVEISPDRVVGLDLATEVTAYMYVWVNEGDPNLVGNWDYEEWVKTYLEDYVKMCEEFEAELSKTTCGQW